VPAVTLVKFNGPPVLYQTLERSRAGKRLLHLFKQQAPDAQPLVLRIDKQVVQKVIVRPDGGEPQAVPVLHGNPNLFIAGRRIEILELPFFPVQPRPGIAPGMQVERAQERAVALLPRANL
jgi:hypothetical protein